jgi:hypothetical protein
MIDRPPMGKAPEAVALYLVWSDNNSEGANNHTPTILVYLLHQIWSIEIKLV